MSTDILYLIIPLLGIPPIVFLIIYTCAKIWGTFIHINENIVNRIPFLNHFIVDPQTHHLHHARNAIYIDKNYGEVLPIYDKIFGTFVQETEKPIYGAVSHSNPAGFWDVQLFEFKKLFADCNNQTSLKNKFLLFIKPPGWKPK